MSPRASRSLDLRRFGLIAAVLGCVALSLPSCEKNPSPGSEAGANPGDDNGGTKEGNLVISDHPCQADSDCVAASCCHPSACVALADAPACEQTDCTTECAPQTMDCGGACLCHEGLCAARLAE